MSENAVATQGSIASLRKRAEALIETRGFVIAITAVIAINAITLGLETWPRAMDVAGPFLHAIDRIALTIFVLELSLKLFALGPRFFRDGWNIFDSIIVAIALMPVSPAISALRALRITRAFRLVSTVPQLRAVVGALFAAVPGMGAVLAMLILVFYVSSVIATNLFAATFPDWFGSIGTSMYSLFQIMTLESWSMGIVRPVMEVHPWAWVFFVPFIIITSFAVLNLFIALIVNSMQTLHDEEVAREADEKGTSAEILAEEIRMLRAEVQELRAHLGDPKPSAETTSPKPDHQPVEQKRV